MTFPPTHAGLLLLADNVSVFTVTTVVLVAVQPDRPLVAVIVYVPPFDVPVMPTDGLDDAELNPAGPCHEYVTPVAVPPSPEVRSTLPPIQAGLLLPADNVSVFTVTVVMLVAEQPDRPLVAVTV